MKHETHNGRRHPSVRCQESRMNQVLVSCFVLPAENKLWGNYIYSILYVYAFLFNSYVYKMNKNQTIYVLNRRLYVHKYFYNVILAQRVYTDRCLIRESMRRHRLLSHRTKQKVHAMLERVNTKRSCGKGSWHFVDFSHAILSKKSNATRL